jgi:hypothetical protein
VSPKINPMTLCVSRKKQVLSKDLVQKRPVGGGLESFEAERLRERALLDLIVWGSSLLSHLWK